MTRKAVKTERDRFERWVKTAWLGSWSFKRSGSGYSDCYVHDAWAAWQASARVRRGRKA
jgi:hypothetical protein